MGIVVIAIVVLVAFAGLMIISTLRRREAEAVGRLSRETRARDRRSRQATSLPEGATGREVERAAQLARQGGELVPVSEPSPPVAFVEPDAEELGLYRRQFLNRSIIGGFILGISGFGVSSIAFLWPSAGGGFGSSITIGQIADVQGEIQEGNGFAYYPEGRMWITAYPPAAIESARAVYSDPELAGMEAGVVALYQVCVHLGCRVPQCDTSQWFECGCHGSFYNQAGERRDGPAPRGLDRFPMSVSGGMLSVDTGTIIQGPPVGTNTTGQEPEGPHCVSGGSH